MKKTVLLLIAAISFLCLVAAPAGADIMLSFDPSSQIVSVGDIVDVDLVISGLEDNPLQFSYVSVSAFDLNVTFDDSILSFVSGTLGDPILGDQVDLSGDAHSYGFEGLDFGVIQSGQEINIFEYSLDVPFDELSQADGFTLATLTFDAIEAGRSLLGLSINALGDAGGLSLEADIDLGNDNDPSRIDVTAPVPEPATLLLLGSGLLGLMGFRRKRRRA